MTNTECITNFFNGRSEKRKVRASLAKQCDFAAVINGKGMEPVYRDGQAVLVKKSHSLLDGEVGLIAYNGRIWVRQYFPTLLRAFSPQGEDFVITPDDEVTILGRVVGVMPEEHSCESPIKRKGRPANKSLTDRERDMINRRYVDKQSLETIGEEYSLTRERVRQIIKKAMEKLPPDTALPLPN